LGLAIDIIYSSPLAANGYTYRIASDTAPAEQEGGRTIAPIPDGPSSPQSAPRPIFDTTAIDSGALAARHRQAAALSAFAAAYVGGAPESGRFVNLQG